MLGKALVQFGASLVFGLSSGGVWAQDYLPDYPLPTPPTQGRERPATLFPSQMSWVNSNDYPSFALSHELQGATKVALVVGRDGRVNSCAITRSSGVQLLDEATCRNVMRRARFYPALNADGNPTTGTFSQRITWRIPSDDPQPSDVLFGPTPVSNPTLWITNNRWSIAPVVPAKSTQVVRPTRRVFKLVTDASGRVLTCTFYANEGGGPQVWGPAVQKKDVAVCTQYRARGRFAPAPGQGGAAVFYAHIDAKIAFKSE